MQRDDLLRRAEEEEALAQAAKGLLEKRYDGRLADFCEQFLWRAASFRHLAASCDSGSHRNGEDAPQSAAEGEASQSGAAQTAHRPPSIRRHPHD